MVRNTSIPPMSSIDKSKITTRGWSSENFSIASVPVAASITVKPARSRMARCVRRA
jgi:hypothetical protein